jgi:hypothetical protein
MLINIQNFFDFNKFVANFAPTKEYLNDKLNDICAENSY